MLPLPTDLPSPEPFSKLGVPLAPELCVLVFRPFERGLAGRLCNLLSPRGGWGNELMLTDLRRVFGVPFAVADSERG